MTNPLPRSGDPGITDELVADHGLSTEEFELVLKILGREPTFTELGVFSAMWSEHCGYKNSKRLLRLLPTKAPWVIQGPGENAGVIEVGDGFALAFKIESHNHPSAVEPYQGAATGVGGILRDIFTMGARPIATLNSLRFGDLDNPRVRYLFAGVVKGVGDYGNCVGIPSIGGEVAFDRGYEGNPIVNAMCLGLMRTEDLILGTAEGVGNTMMAVGARTGRDGIHGATFASEELSEDSDEASRPQVQVGDPFTEKLLLEASLELIKSGHIVGIQDMGAAGLTSSAAEMAGRAGNGIEIDTTKVPVRESGMTPYEILLSESQERMLVVSTAGHESDVQAILEKWELEAEVIGRVTDTGTFRVLEDGVVVADIPALPLTDGCPTYERPGEEGAEVKALRTMDLSDYSSADSDIREVMLQLISSPNIASRQWIYEQYDTTVRGNAVARPGGDAGVVRIPGTKRGVAATTDCNGRYTYLNPRRGALGAVAEAARNLACVGALPTAVTNNLNFGNPLKPHIYHQF
ncbi:MAG: phosphoribosylformylglycinamidine synthase subunit PurL, partial [Longimicrobiales bacterium]